MKTFALAALAACVSAQMYGTTGHIGNTYGHTQTKKDHPDEDHDYGYDSVPVEDYMTATEITDQLTTRDSIIAQVATANTGRIAALEKVFQKRNQRLTEIHNQNQVKITAPFEYQTRLLGEEENDVLRARNNAVRDANDAYDDLVYRLDYFKLDLETAFDNEAFEINDMIDRAVIDKKHPCKVISALRIEWISGYFSCVIDTTTTTVTVLTTAEQGLDIYDSVFDDFHYDIGHGKGHGVGAVDAAPVTDGFGPGPAPPQAVRGDFQTQQGMRTHAWEKPGRAGRF